MNLKFNLDPVAHNRLPRMDLLNNFLVQIKNSSIAEMKLNKDKPSRKLKRKAIR